MTLDRIAFIKRLFPLLFYVAFAQYQQNLTLWQRSKRNSELAKKRRIPNRILWSVVNKRISNLQFRRMLRMTRECFGLLCSKIITHVGESRFKSESYINAFCRPCS